MESVNWLSLTDGLTEKYMQIPIRAPWNDICSSESLKSRIIVPGNPTETLFLGSESWKIKVRHITEQIQQRALKGCTRLDHINNEVF
jgi:hypothetical protein